MRTPKGKSAFENYYRQFFPDEEKFSQFLKNLTHKSTPILFVPTQKKSEFEAEFKKHNLSYLSLDWYENAYYWPREVAFGQTLPGYKDHLFYPMSASSLLPVLGLDLKPEDSVLDACAAPGGKALCIQTYLDSDQQLTCNDLSYARLMRMQHIFKNYGINPKTLSRPAEKLSKYIADKFDKILVDAPCSSEAHVYKSKKHLDRWSIKRVQKLSNRQIKLIQSLIPLLKKDGRLVYSTCAVTPEENEKVVQTVLKSSPVPLKLVNLEIEGFEDQKGLSGYDIDPTNVIRIWPGDKQMEPIFVAAFELLETNH